MVSQCEENFILNNHCNEEGELIFVFYIEVFKV